MHENLEVLAKKFLEAQLMQINGDYNGAKQLIYKYQFYNLPATMDAEFKNIIGVSLRAEGNFEAAKNQHTDVLKLLGDHDNDQAYVQSAMARTNLAELCRLEHNFNDALAQHNIAIEVAPNNTVALARAHLYKGILMTHWGKVDEALNCYLNARKYGLLADDSVEDIREHEKLKSLRAVARGFMGTDRYAEAKPFVDLVVHQSKEKKPKVATDILIKLGDKFIEKKDYQDAIPVFVEAFNIYNISGHNAGRSRAMLGLTVAYSENCEVAKAQETLKQYDKHQLSKRDRGSAGKKLAEVREHLSHIKILPRI